MHITTEKLDLFYEYSRPQLAELWDYLGYEAISRGVVLVYSSFRKIVL